MAKKSKFTPNLYRNSLQFLVTCHTGGPIFQPFIAILAEKNTLVALLLPNQALLSLYSKCPPKTGGKNAKERQTLTNCGNTTNYNSFKNIIENENFEDCECYKKCKRFILFVRNDDKQKLKTGKQIII